MTRELSVRSSCRTRRESCPKHDIPISPAIGAAWKKESGQRPPPSDSLFGVCVISTTSSFVIEEPNGCTRFRMRIGTSQVLLIRLARRRNVIRTQHTASQRFSRVVSGHDRLARTHGKRSTAGIDSTPAPAYIRFDSDYIIQSWQGSANEILFRSSMGSTFIDMLDSDRCAIGIRSGYARLMTPKNGLRSISGYGNSVVLVLRAGSLRRHSNKQTGFGNSAASKSSLTIIANTMLRKRRRCLATTTNWKP